MVLLQPPVPNPSLSPERRKELGRLLKAIPGVQKAYFQPPGNVQLVYPCIIYVRDDVETNHADNRPYLQVKRYLLTIIDEDPDSEIPDVVAAFPHSAFVRRYETQGLNHDIYSLYF